MHASATSRTEHVYIVQLYICFSESVLTSFMKKVSFTVVGAVLR